MSKLAKMATTPLPEVGGSTVQYKMYGTTKEKTPIMKKMYNTRIFLNI